MRHILWLACLAALPVHAAEFSPPSRIDAVTVFPDGARITRRMELELPAGAHAILVKGLPASVDPGFIRVEGEGGSALSIGAVDLKQVPGDAQPVVDAALEAKLKAARDAREALQTSVEALTRKRAMIERYAQASPEKLGADNAPLAVEDWSKAWEAVGSALSSTNEELRKLAGRARELDAEIRTLENARPRPTGIGRPKLDVAVAVEADAAFKGRLTLHYRIGGASWQAAYDARLATGSAEVAPKLELVRRALVSQRTGEDWAEVELSVSTARTAGSTAAPVIHAVQVSFLELPPPGAFRREERGRLAAPAPGGMAVVPPPAAAPAESLDAAKPKVVAQEQVAQVETTAFEATFRVPGRITVPGDGSQKTFRIGSRTIEPKLTVKSVPALDQTAYLVVEAENSDDAPLMAGQVTLTRDGNFVGTAQLAFAAPGDKFELGFGADERVKVSRVPLSRRESDPVFLNNNRTDLRDFRTTVENLHTRPVTVTILDQIPFTEIATITVEQMATSTTPTDKIVASKRGVMGWTYTLKPKEKKEIRVTFRIRYPADREIVFTARPLPDGR